MRVAGVGDYWAVEKLVVIGWVVGVDFDLWDKAPSCWGGFSAFPGSAEPSVNILHREPGRGGAPLYE